MVFHLESLWLWERARVSTGASSALLRQIARANAVVSIRGDIPGEFGLRWPGVLHVQPSVAVARSPGDVWLPLLPQRGLAPRRQERFGCIRTVGVFAYASNVPTWVHSDSFRAALAALGIETRLRLLEPGGADPRWHDYSDVDAVLCVRTDPLGTGHLRKPATKLVNAWVAGCVPLVSAEPAYLELGRPGDDCLVVSDADSVVAALRRLTTEAGRVAVMEGHVSLRAQEFARERVLQRWVDVLFDPAVPTLTRTQSASAHMRAVLGAAASVRARGEGLPPSEFRSGL